MDLQCRSLQQQWLQPVSIKIMGTRYEQYPPVFGGLMEVYFAAPEPVDKNRRSIVGSTKPQWRAISVPCIAIQVLPINGAREEATRRESVVPTLGG